MTKLVHHETCVQPHGLSSGLPAACVSQAVPHIARSRSSLLHSKSPMRSRGLYGWHISEEKQPETCIENTWCFGVCLPSWFIFTSISLAVILIIARLKDGRSIQWSLRIQNRVALTSPLMRACQIGDVALIRQIIKDKHGSVHDRSMCHGTTPLIVRVPYHILDPNLTDADRLRFVDGTLKPPNSS